VAQTVSDASWAGSEWSAEDAGPHARAWRRAASKARARRLRPFWQQIAAKTG
jgi:hypothetical protein